MKKKKAKDGESITVYRVIDSDGDDYWYESDVVESIEINFGDEPHSIEVGVWTKTTTVKE